MLYAYVKKEDWLKTTANKLLSRIVKENSARSTPQGSTPEIYYVSKAEAFLMNS